MLYKNPCLPVLTIRIQITFFSILYALTLLLKGIALHCTVHIGSYIPTHCLWLYTILQYVYCTTVRVLYVYGATVLHQCIGNYSHCLGSSYHFIVYRKILSITDSIGSYYHCIGCYKYRYSVLNLLLAYTPRLYSYCPTVYPYFHCTFIGKLKFCKSLREKMFRI